MEDNTKHVAKYFDENYQFWVINKRLSIRRQYLSLLENVAGKTILDMGCGIGLDAELLSQKGSKGVGIDLSKKSINVCLQKKIKNWEFFVDDSETCFSGSNFDIVMSNMEIMYHSEFEKTFKHYSDCLKPDGKLLLVTNNPYLMSLEYKLNYSHPIQYQHHFANKKQIVLKYHYPLETYFSLANCYNMKISLYKEVYCTEDECKNYDLKNELKMPEFLTFLYQKEV